MEYEFINNVLVIRFFGEIDNQVVNKYRNVIVKLIRDSDSNYLILNLDYVTYIDSAGIGLILGRYNQIKEKDGKAAIVGVNDVIDHLFSITGIYKIMRCFETEKEALDSFEVIYE